MPTKIPKISEVIDRACRFVKAAPGYDINAAEGRAFTRAFFKEVLRMKPIVAVKFLAKCLTRYSKEK